MPEPINDLDYWKQRLEAAPKGREHEAVFRCSKERWAAIEKKHRDILALHIKPFDSVLDCGCGWGRLLLMLPPNWHGLYLGVDLSPDFIHKALVETIPLAQKIYNGQNGMGNRPGAFQVSDLRDLSRNVFLPGRRKWDWAVMVSVRPMVKRNLGGAEWDKMEAEIRKCAEKLLYLEYDPDDEGSVE
jgi:hypothetical protein